MNGCGLLLGGALGRGWRAQQPARSLSSSPLPPQVVSHRELWRCLSAQLCHVDLLHLAFNLSALWSLGLVEGTPGLGTPYLLQHTALLLLLSPAVRAPGPLLQRGALRHATAASIDTCRQARTRTPTPPPALASLSTDLPAAVPPAHHGGAARAVPHHHRRGLLLRPVWPDDAAGHHQPRRAVFGFTCVAVARGRGEGLSHERSHLCPGALCDPAGSRHSPAHRPCCPLHAGGITLLPLFGLASVPVWATPWASLALTSLLIPQARCTAVAGGLGGVGGQRLSGCLASWC